jgi:hypothetical protein
MNLWFENDGITLMHMIPVISEFFKCLSRHYSRTGKTLAGVI